MGILGPLHYLVGLLICAFVVWINLRMSPEHAVRAGQASDSLVRLLHISRTAIVAFVVLVGLAKLAVAIKPDLSMNPTPRQAADLLAITAFASVIFATRYPV